MELIKQTQQKINRLTEYVTTWKLSGFTDNEIGVIVETLSQLNEGLELEPIEQARTPHEHGRSAEQDYNRRIWQQTKRGEQDTRLQARVRNALLPPSQHPQIGDVIAFRKGEAYGKIVDANENIVKYDLFTRDPMSRTREWKHTGTTVSFPTSKLEKTFDKISLEQGGRPVDVYQPVKLR